MDHFTHGHGRIETSGRVVALWWEHDSHLARALEHSLLTHRIDVSRVTSFADLKRQAALRATLAAVLGPDVCGDVRAAHHIERVRQEQPHLPIFCCVDLSLRRTPRLSVFARVGADAAFPVKDANDTNDLSNVVVQSALHVLPATLVRDLVKSVPTDIQPIVSWALRNAWHGVRASDLATQFDADRSTLARQLRHAHAPSTASMLRLCRVAHMCAELDFRRHTERAIAKRLGFNADSAVRMFVRRTMGSSVSSLRGRATEQLEALWNIAYAVSRHSVE